MLCCELDRQLRHRDVGLLLDAADQEIAIGIELARPCRSALRRGRERAGLFMPRSQLDCERCADREILRRTATGLAAGHAVDQPLAQIQ